MNLLVITVVLIRHLRCYAVTTETCKQACYYGSIKLYNPVTKLYRRGRRIFASVLEELIATKAMGNAANALLMGDSAGGLATILNCDRFHSFLPDACRVKCVSDAGFFIRGKDLPGALDHALDYFSEVVKYHKLAKYLPKSCTQRLAPELTGQQAIGDWYFERNNVQFIDHLHRHPIYCNDI
ncbi:[Wnt protein] O-palmitoleoyl-L-serine hydrolase [Salvia divinorum]|uniref:Pectin acetylesterase n=1 Tax=Salvia divinorum TaxID=28513 RepID=A0ABD1FGK3_SALDI